MLSRAKNHKDGKIDKNVTRDNDSTATQGFAIYQRIKMEAINFQ